METRNIPITLDKAREWYKSEGILREIALQAFTEEEISPGYVEIKTWEDAVNVLDLDIVKVMLTLSTIRKMSKASAAAFKVNLIRQALNKGQKMSFTEGTIRYPYTPSVTKESTYYNDELRDGEMVEVAQFTHNGKTYRLLGGRADIGSYVGLGGFDSDDGVADAGAGVGFLGCATKEIAEHMSKYFAKEIFEAKYGDLIDFEWLT